MFVLDTTYTSPEVLEFLETSHEPVFNNDPARALAAQGHQLNLQNTVAKNERIFATSEMYLDAVKHIAPHEYIQAVDRCKNKAAVRQTLAPLYPTYQFSEYTLEEVLALQPNAVSYPAVLKPTVGFFSIGIYLLTSADSLQAAQDDIRANSNKWDNSYGSTVINNTHFIVESYIEGQEYALDAYFDEAGNAVILNILQHDFASTEDTSDRLYYTGKHVIETQLERMTTFLQESNIYLGFRNFCVHVEMRVQEDGTVIPIEFNPGRFAGLCNTDIAYFAYGFKPYEYFLHNQRPNWKELLAKREGVTYAMIVLPGAIPQANTSRFNYDKLQAQLSNVLSLRPLDVTKTGTFGFVFAEVSNTNWQREIIPLLTSTLEEFLLPAE